MISNISADFPISKISKICFSLVSYSKLFSFQTSRFYLIHECFLEDMNNDVGRDRFASEEYINKSDKIIANDFQERLSLNQSQAVSVGLQNDQKSDCANDSWSNLSDSIPMNHISEQFDSLQIEYVNYKDETQMQDIMRLIEKDLSEPYSIYTYRYFIHNWPQLCFLVSEFY